MQTTCPFLGNLHKQPHKTSTLGLKLKSHRQLGQHGLSVARNENLKLGGALGAFPKTLNKRSQILNPKT